ncbi:hypothetical protein ACNOYE_24940 [Nannocystaceae bacterium ST9]
MQVVCSFCHTRFAEPVGAEGESTGHVVCPKCKAEAGIEPIKAETPKPMRVFGAILATAGFLVVVISGFVVVAG